MKNFLRHSYQYILFVVIAATLFSACRQENIITSPDNENSIIDNNSIIADIIMDIAANDGSIDNIIDSANCFRIKLPVTVFVNGREVIVNTNDDLDLIRAIFDESSVDTDMIDIMFPVTVVLTDYSEKIINNQNEFNDLSQTCNGEDEPDDDIECIDFLFPISFTVFNTITEQTDEIIIENDKELFLFVEDLSVDDVASLHFPITMILSDASLETVYNLEELEILVERVKDDCDEDDDFDYSDDDFFDAEDPSTPLNLTASNITETSVDLIWDTSTDNIGIASYGIYRDDVFVVSTISTSITISALVASTEYVFTVNARDIAGNISDKSNSITIQTLISSDVSPPSAPLNLTALNTTQTTTDLTWDASIDNIGVTSYEVYNNGVLISSSNTTAYQVSSLTENTLYTFNIIAKDAANNSSISSNLVAITTLTSTGDTEAPTAPLNLIASNTTASTTDLSWDPSTDNIGVVGYEIYRDGTLWIYVTGTTYTAIDLIPESTYIFSVLAKDAEGNSSTLSNNVSVTTLAVSEVLDIDDVITTCTDWGVENFENNGSPSDEFANYTFNFESDGSLVVEDVITNEIFIGTWKVSSGKLKMNVPGIGGSFNSNWTITTVVRSDGTTIIELNSGTKILIFTTTTCN